VNILLKTVLNTLEQTINVKDLTKVLVAITFLVTALGGTIRIYDAGESCPDWPTCFGSLGFIISESEQSQWYDENPDEIDSRGSGHTYTTFQIFTEWIHRFLAGVILGPLVVLNWILVKRNVNYGREIEGVVSLSFILIIWQGIVGMLTVKMNNEHWSVALHLASALAFMMSLIWIWIIISRDEKTDWLSFDPALAYEWKNKLMLMMILTLLTLMSGTLVSTSGGANLGCGVGGFYQSWPLCQGELLSPIKDIVAQSQMIHRWLVASVGILLAGMSYSLWQKSENSEHSKLLSKWFLTATAIYTANILLGGLYVISWTIDGYMEILSLIHLILASAVFIILATIRLGISIIALHEENYQLDT